MGWSVNITAPGHIPDTWLVTKTTTFLFQLASEVFSTDSLSFLS